MLRTRSTARDALAGVERVARRVIPGRIKRSSAVQRAAAALRPAPIHELLPVLDALGGARPAVFFIQIGSNDGDQQDPLRERDQDPGLVRCDGRTRAVRLRALAPKLCRRARHRARENVAVAASDGEALLHHLREANDDERARLPRWYDALGSFDRDVVLSHRAFIPDIDERIVSTTVPTVTFATLCGRHCVEAFDVLHIDTEGADAEILALVDLHRFEPLLVIYEHAHLSDSTGAGLATAWRTTGTTALNTASIPGRFVGRRCDQEKMASLRSGLLAGGGHRPTWIAALANRPPVSPGSRRSRTKTAGASSRPPTRAGPRLPTPPSGCAQTTHASLTFGPATRPCGCPSSPTHNGERPTSSSSSTSAGSVGTRCSSGTTESCHERRSSSSSFYLEYVASRDHAGVLGRLHEDGLFGAWTYEFPGRVPVSRDLLESANELLFLDRVLGVTDATTLRIVDIGAGTDGSRTARAKRYPGCATTAASTRFPKPHSSPSTTSKRGPAALRRGSCPWTS